MGIQYSKPNKQENSCIFWQILHCAICCETIETKPQLNALFVTNSENTYFSFDLIGLCYSEYFKLS